MHFLNFKVSKLKFFYKGHHLPFLSSKKLNITLIVAGIFLRLRLFLENRSFDIDETWRAMKIYSQSFQEILRNKPFYPDLPQIPLGFAILEKIFVFLFGNNEYVFRFLPLLCGILSVFLFYVLIKQIVRPKAVPVALGLFALSDYMVFYSAETKPYASDILATIFLLWFFVYLKEKVFDVKNGVLLAVVGSLVIWISHVSIFALVAMGLAFALLYWKRKEKRKLALLLLSGLFWIASAYLLYKFSLEGMVTDKNFLAIWKSYFVPYPLWSLNSIFWVGRAFTDLFFNPSGLMFPLFAAILFVVGSLRIYLSRREIIIFIILTLVIIFIAAVLHKYPFRGRPMLFIVPLLFIPVSEGALVLINKSGKYKFFIGALAMSLLFYGPVINSARSLVLGEGRGDMLYEDNREAVSYYKDHYQEADLLFFNHSAQYPFFYYINHYSLQEKIAHALGRNNGFSGIRVGVFSDDIRQDKSDQLFMLLAFRYYLYDNNKFKGTMMRDKEHLGVYEMHRDTALDFIDQKRVWVFLSHLEKEEKEFILKIFQKNGKQLKEKRFSRVSLHLFELDPSQNKANF